MKKTRLCPRFSSWRACRFRQSGWRLLREISTQSPLPFSLPFLGSKAPFRPEMRNDCKDAQQRQQQQSAQANLFAEITVT